MSIRTLPALEGTQYSARVVKDNDGDLILRVFRPATQTEAEMFHPATGQTARGGVEEVAARVLAPTTDEHVLNRVVEDIVRAQRPSIIGEYAGTNEEETE